MNPFLVSRRWRKETGARVEGSRPLDSAKLQAPCVVRNPTGGIRLFYTAVGPGKPYPACQGYILSAVSDNGLAFRKESGIRLAPRPELPYNSLRVLAPTISQCSGNLWRMYFESRGPADQSTAICSAVSTDMLNWELDDGIRLHRTGGVGGPRYLPLPDGCGRLYCIAKEFRSEGSKREEQKSQGVVSAITTDGIHFEFEPGYRLQARQTAYDSLGITAAEVIPPGAANSQWIMFYSAWQNVPPGTAVPVHPSCDTMAVESGRSDDFAAASIVVDMAGYRSRIFTAHSTDGLLWERGECVIEGGGYKTEGLDAVHAEDMSLIKIGEGVYRMYYAACDKDGNWRIASAVTDEVIAPNHSVSRKGGSSRLRA